VVEAFSTEAYPACTAAITPRKAYPLFPKPTCGALRARGAAHTACWRTRGPLAHLLSSGRIGLPPARGTKAPLDLLKIIAMIGSKNAGGRLARDEQEDLPRQVRVPRCSCTSHSIPASTFRSSTPGFHTSCRNGCRSNRFVCRSRNARAARPHGSPACTRGSRRCAAAVRANSA
jgi:hypothetical protein